MVLEHKKGENFREHRLIFAEYECEKCGKTYTKWNNSHPYREDAERHESVCDARTKLGEGEAAIGSTKQSVDRIMQLFDGASDLSESLVEKLRVVDESWWTEMSGCLPDQNDIYGGYPSSYMGHWSLKEKYNTETYTGLAPIVEGIIAERRRLLQFFPGVIEEEFERMNSSLRGCTTLEDLEGSKRLADSRRGALLHTIEACGHLVRFSEMKDRFEDEDLTYVRAFCEVSASLGVGKIVTANNGVKFSYYPRPKKAPSRWQKLLGRSWYHCWKCHRMDTAYISCRINEVEKWEEEVRLPPGPEVYDDSRASMGRVNAPYDEWETRTEKREKSHEETTFLCTVCGAEWRTGDTKRFERYHGNAL